jgi:DNA-binding XRE family transcriptional regulator
MQTGDTDNVLAMTISEKIKGLRDGVKMTQTQLASLCGVSEASIKNAESGRHAPSLDTVVAIGKTFNVSIDWLVNEGYESTGDEELRIRLNAVKDFDLEDQKTVTAVIEAMQLKTQAKKLLSKGM